ncbi:MAG TPA: protein kinase, partial [Gemmatales bacterium]|nr:protein kinase [Gemmatales bacterium]
NRAHRDIKPANILVDKTGQVKILDLGLARSFQVSQDNLTMDLSDGKDVMGSIDYIAPEQAIANNVVDIRADIYSLGATLYCLITGKPPVEGTTAQKLLQHQMTMPVPVNHIQPEVPEGVAQVLAKMLAKKPDHRFRTPSEVANALTPFISSLSQPLPALSSTQLHLSLAPNTGNLYKPNTSNLLQTSPIQQAGNSRALSSQSTKIEAKSTTKRVKPATKPITLESNISPRTLMIIGGIAAVLIPLITIYAITGTETKPITKSINPALNFNLKGEKYEVKPNSSLPDITVKDFSGNEFNFANDEKGKVRIVLFWGYWCQHCTKLLPKQIKLAEKYANRPLAILGINTDALDDYEVGSKRLSVPWRNIRNNQADGVVISKLMGVKSSPTIMVLDHLGKVRAVWEVVPEEKEFNEMIESWVKSAETAAKTTPAGDSNQTKK